MADSSQTLQVQVKQTTPPHKKWRELKIGLKKDANNDAQIQDTYDEYLRGNGFLNISRVLQSARTKAISLLTTNITTRKKIGVSREIKRLVEHLTVY